MIRLTLDLIPKGDERAAIRLGTVEIENDCTGDEAIGNYHVRQRGMSYADATLKGIRRTRGHWNLVLAALMALVGSPAYRKEQV